MSKAVDLFRLKEEQILNALATILRETAFENQYSLHPRRLLGLGTELWESCLGFLDTLDREAAFSCGQKCAQEGLGEKAIFALVSSIQHFSLEELGRDTRLIEDVDSFIRLLLEGFMATRKAQILKDQEQLRRALSTALESQGRELNVKNQAIDSSVNGIMLANLDGRITWVNASLIALLGYVSSTQLVGARMADVWADEDVQRGIDDLSRTGGWRGEVDGKNRDGDVISLELSASLIRSAEGNAIGIMTSIVDVSERKRLQSQVLQVQKMDALGQLAGGITHDFNNLLAGIIGYVDLLLIDTAQGTQIHHDLMQIKIAADRGAGLTRQLRLFTRQATGKRQIVSLNEIAQETWEIIKRTFPPDIAAELLLDPSLWSIDADPNQISQVLINLCVNARDAMMDRSDKKAGGKLTLETSNLMLTELQTSRYLNARPGSYVVLRVSDTGIGMSSELLNKLFIPFVTTKGNRSGTGLGLAVVYGVVTSHHGFIDVQSEVGKGSTFTIAIPRSEQPVKQPGKAAPTAALARGRGCILVVDDEQQVCDLMARVLTSCGYNVLQANNGRSALQLFADGRGIDLVILDIMMPEMGGRECLARMRMIQPGVRVVVTTGYTSDDSAEELLSEGAVEIMEKPLDLQVLAEKVKNAIGRPENDG